MVDRDSSESKEHKDLVGMMANYFKAQNYSNVKADLDGWDTPTEINGHVPDVTATINGISIILEAETCKSIDTTDTKDQLKAFYEAAKSGNREFHLVVPKSCMTAAKLKLLEWGISASQVWSPQ